MLGVHLMRPYDPDCFPTRFTTADDANVVLLTFKCKKK